MKMFLAGLVVGCAFGWSALGAVAIAASLGAVGLVAVAIATKGIE